MTWTITTNDIIGAIAIGLIVWGLLAIFRAVWIAEKSGAPRGLLCGAH